MQFFGRKYGQDLENRAAHPHQELPGVPPRREIRPKAGEFSHVPNLMQISTSAIDSVTLKKLTAKTVAQILLVANVGSLEKRSNQLKY